MATKRKEPVEESPGFCKTAELANLFGVSSQWINELTKNGILKRRDTPAGKRFNVVESTRSLIQHLRDKAKGREKREPDDRELEKMDAETRYKLAKARKMELETQELEGKMHRSEDVEAMTTDLLFAVRGALTAMPGRLAMDIAGVGSPAEAADMIRREVGAILREIAEYRYDPAKYEERVRERKQWEMNHPDEDEDES